eukprot:6479581-Amphidinium_carterae.1
MVRNRGRRSVAAFERRALRNRARRQGFDIVPRRKPAVVVGAKPKGQARAPRQKVQVKEEEEDDYSYSYSDSSEPELDLKVVSELVDKYKTEQDAKGT